jgi:hypothetical protein
MPLHVLPRVNHFVDSSPNRFVGALTTVEAGESSAECFDEFPPRQLEVLSSPGAMG